MRMITKRHSGPERPAMASCFILIIGGLALGTTVAGCDSRTPSPNEDRTPPIAA